MKPRKVLIISKTTAWEMGVDNSDEEELKAKHDSHVNGLEYVVSLFKNNKINPEIRSRLEISDADFMKHWDLVVSVGGDGTLMNVASHILDETPVLAIRSSDYSDGGHCNSNLSKAEEHIKRWLKGDYILKKEQRVRGEVFNSKRIVDYALNEINVGDIYDVGNSKFEILLDGKKYSCSGSSLVISAYDGKTGWYDHVPLKNHNKKMEFSKLEGETLRYKVRESRSNIRRYGYDYGIVRPGQEFVIISKMRADGAATFDGNKPYWENARVYGMRYGDRIRISLSDKPLYMVSFD